MEFRLLFIITRLYHDFAKNAMASRMPSTKKKANPPPVAAAMTMVRISCELLPLVVKE